MFEAKVFCSSTAYEVDDLVAIAGDDFRFFPLLSRQNFQVPLDCHAPILEPELAQQVNHGLAGNRRP